MRPLVAAALFALAACAAIGSQVKDACPESRDLVCRKGDVVCSPDAARGCQVCACGGSTTRDASGALRGPVPAEQIPARPANVPP